LLVVTDEKPPCPVHIMRKCGGKYYWVPPEAGPVFLQLVLRTTFMRGPDTAPPPPTYYEVKVVGVDRLRDKTGTVLDPSPAGDVTFYIQFDKKVPNGDARMVATLKGGRKVRLNLEQVDFYNVQPGDKARKQAPPPGQPIDQLIGRWNPT